MKKYFYSFGLLLFTGLTVVLNSCGDDEPSRAVQSVELNKATLALIVDESETLTATITPEFAIDNTVIWSSSNNTIATVDAMGKVTAIADGTATITATVSDKTATCTVTVSSISVADISLDINTLDMWANTNQTLVATVLPENATDKTIAWTSSDNAIAGVSETGIVTAIAAGTATITAKSGDKQVTCTVTIKAIPTDGVLINNVVWAKYSMTEENGVIIITEGSGKFYQWNRKTAWENTGSITGWNSSAESGVEWKRENDPCPLGWRIPTIDQLRSLTSAGSTRETVNSVAGIRFGTGDNSIFLPAAGYRNYQVGTLGNVGEYGNYWARTASKDMESVRLFFTATGQVSIETRSEAHIRAAGQCVRCVAEK